MKTSHNNDGEAMAWWYYPVVFFLWIWIKIGELCNALFCGIFCIRDDDREEESEDFTEIEDLQNPAYYDYTKKAQQRNTHHPVPCPDLMTLVAPGFISPADMKPAGPNMPGCFVPITESSPSTNEGDMIIWPADKTLRMPLSAVKVHDARAFE